MTLLLIKSIEENDLSPDKIRQTGMLLIQKIGEQLDNEAIINVDDSEDKRASDDIENPPRRNILTHQIIYNALSIVYQAFHEQSEMLGEKEIQDIVLSAFEDEYEIPTIPIPRRPIILAPFTDKLDIKEREAVFKDLGVYVSLGVGIRIMDRDFELAHKLRNLCRDWGLLTEDSNKELGLHSAELVTNMLKSADPEEALELFRLASFYGFISKKYTNEIEQIFEQLFVSEICNQIVNGDYNQASYLFIKLLESLKVGNSKKLTLLSNVIKLTLHKLRDSNTAKVFTEFHLPNTRFLESLLSKRLHSGEILSQEDYHRLVGLAIFGAYNTVE
jgi:hypothetical protein